MVELAVVVLILAILGGMTAPAVAAAMRHAKIRSAAAFVSGALRRARNRAIREGGFCYVRLRSGPQPAGDEVEHCLYSWVQASWPADGKEYDYDRLQLPPEAKVTSSVAFVVFLPDGSAWWSGDKATFTVADADVGGEPYVISISRLSGRIETKR